MTRPRGIALALAAAVVLTSCASGGTSEGAADGQFASSDQEGPERTSAAGPTNGQTLDARAFADRIEREPTLVLDVRTPEEFAQGHLEGAVNIDVGAADFGDRIADLAPQDRYAVYCRTGARSAQAMQTMLDQGFTDVAHLDGGIGAWEASGGDVVSAP